MSLTTYVLGFWKVPNNKKNSIEHYYTWFPKTFEMLKNKNVVFFYEDDEILDYVRAILRTDSFISIKLSVTDLPTYSLSDDYLNSCKGQDNQRLKTLNDRKGITHYSREYIQSGEDAYKKVISIWTSKVLLIQRIAEENPFGTSTFAWVDVSVSRFKRSCLQRHKKGTISTYPNGNSYMGESISNLAAYMISDISTWNLLFPLYKTELESLRHSNYAHDEETILHIIRKKNKALFSHIPINQEESK